jgi:hypothetical protein
LTKSHVDVWVSANRVCSGRARRLVALCGDRGGTD